MKVDTYDDLTSAEKMVYSHGVNFFDGTVVSIQTTPRVLIKRSSFHGNLAVEKGSCVHGNL